nr:unnamed protein product [Haemonchus contortus]
MLKKVEHMVVKRGNTPGVRPMNNLVPSGIENFFALHIRNNSFLRRIDFNENLILNGAYFIRLNAKEMEIYSGGKPNSTILWNDPAGSTFYGR